MKNKIVLLAAILAALALAGCNNTSGSVSKNAVQTRDISSYTAFLPKTEGELAEAAAAGDVNAGYMIVKTVSDFDPSRFAALGAEVVGSFEMDGSTYFRLHKAVGAVKLVTDLNLEKGVIYAEHDLLSKIPANETSSTNSASLMSRDAANIASFFNDPETWGRFGHFELTGAIDAYKAHGLGSNTIYVADIDTGINRTHEDFATADGGQIIEYAKSAFESVNGGASFTWVGEGKPFVEVPTYENWDDVGGEGHGSHTAGTIAAVGNNGVGVAGVCYGNARLISYKVFCTGVTGSGGSWSVYGSLADLVAWKQAHKVTQTIPVNMSLGGSYASQFALEMVNKALDNNIMIIASMGNDGYNKAQYPAGYSGVLAVGATRSNGQKVHFSTMNNSISISAPGYNIYSVGYESDDHYQDMSGTSMAAPFVTGTVAYLLTMNPTMSPGQIKTLLETTATDMGATGYDEDTGWGLINVKAAADIVAAGTTLTSNYSTKTTKVFVKNGNSHYDSGITGYRSAVPAQAVYIYDSDGEYYCNGLTNGTDGSVEFKLLKAGDYVAKTNYFGVMKEQSFTVNNSNDISITLGFDIATVLIQTVPNTYFSNGATDADSIVSLYAEDGTTLLAGPYDKGSLDTLVVSGLTVGTTYKVLVEPYYSRWLFDRRIRHRRRLHGRQLRIGQPWPGRGLR